MRLHYLTKDGKSDSIELTEKPITIGRSGDADVLILDEKASRVHCGIRFWDSEYFVKDLKSKNGTFVNDTRVDIHQLSPGDRIRVGATMFIFEQEAATGTDTALVAMQDAFDGGKGYGTILREIVNEADAPSPHYGARAAPESIGDLNDDGVDEDATPTRKRKVLGGKKKAPRAPLERKPLQVKIKRTPPDDDE